MNYKPTWEVIWIDNIEQLEQVIPVLEKEEYLAVDTETSGWQSGNEKLCLVQIGAPTVERNYLIDVLNIPGWEMIDPILSKVQPSIIAHNASFEQRQFARHSIKMRGVIDTLKMATKLRPDLPNRTLKTCCKYVLGIELDKEQQVSDWSERPLTQEQIDYAAIDAEVTYKLYAELAAMEEKISIQHEASVADLMQELYQSEQEEYLLTKEIAAEIQLLSLRKEMLRDAIRAKLINGEEAYEGQYGQASIQKVKRTEINPQEVRARMPEIADLVIIESVQRQKLKDLMEEHGIAKNLLEEVTEILRYDDRLKLNLADF